MEEMNSEQAKEICKECDGSGEILIKEPLDKFYSSIGECKKCNGTGKVEWIENIIKPRKGTWLKPGVYFNEVDYSTTIQSNFDFIKKNIIAATGIPKKLFKPNYGSSLSSILSDDNNDIKLPDLKIDMVEIKPRVFDKNEIKEDEIEICPKCNGNGLNNEPIKDPTADRHRECVWCGGNGRISWLDKIYKRAKRIPGKLRANWSIDVQQDLVNMHSIDLEEEITTLLSQEILKEIEKDK